MSTDYFEQQPIARTVGRRTPPRAGALPPAETRAAITRALEELRNR